MRDFSSGEKKGRDRFERGLFFCGLAARRAVRLRFLQHWHVFCAGTDCFTVTLKMNLRLRRRLPRMEERRRSRRRVFSHTAKHSFAARQRAEPDSTYSMEKGRVRFERGLFES